MDQLDVVQVPLASSPVFYVVPIVSSVYDASHNCVHYYVVGFQVFYAVPVAFFIQRSRVLRS